MLVGSVDGQLCLLDYRYRRMRRSVDSRLCRHLHGEMVEQGSAVIDATCAQVEEYLSGSRREFDVPLRFAGSPFQVAVWEYLLRIPYGETRTYSQMAEELGRPDAFRAVAAANGANAMSLVVPCHRIIERDGGLAGYAGGLRIKKRLLALES
jgi:methylated-DNA-[protein]-cysteine S-methyltransferase